MSLNKTPMGKTPKGKGRMKTFKMRYPHSMDQTWWHTVEARNRKEALEEFAKGTVFDPKSIVIKGEEFKGMSKADKKRIMGMDRQELEARTVNMFEKAVGSKVDSVDKEDWQAWRIDTEDGDSYLLFGSYSAAEQYAQKRVEDDLYDSPEMFNQDWLEGHFDEDALIRDLDYDGYFNSIAYDEVKYNPEAYDLTQEDVDDNSQDFIDAVEKVEEQERQNIRDEGGLQWLKDTGAEGEQIYRHIDIKEASKDAVNTDGWLHFVNSWDGEELWLDDGSVYTKVG